MPREQRENQYYYADDQRIELTPADDLLAVDEHRLAVASVADGVRREVHQAAQPLRENLSLVRREALSPGTADALKQAGVLQPVFRAHDAIVIVLPEVRVEEHRPGGQERLQAWLDAHNEQARVRSQREGRLVLEPASGQGGDALALANELHEQVKPEMAQSRFVRILPRPATPR